MTELLDWKAVWNETFRRQCIYAEDGSNASITTALHGMDSGKISLVADLELLMRIGNSTAKLEMKMTPEEMETMAGYLTDAAEWQRELIKRLDAHNAATEVAREGEARQAEAA